MRNATSGTVSSRPKGGSPGVGAVESSSSNPSDAIKWANITMLAVLCSSTRRTVVPDRPTTVWT
ncbi:hypothetical protein ACFQ0G_46155 [Streptomyces chiangmaiensis]